MNALCIQALKERKVISDFPFHVQGALKNTNGPMQLLIPLPGSEVSKPVKRQGQCRIITTTASDKVHPLLIAGSESGPWSTFGHRVLRRHFPHPVGRSEFDLNGPRLRTLCRGAGALSRSGVKQLRVDRRSA